MMKLNCGGFVGYFRHYLKHTGQRSLRWRTGFGFLSGGGLLYHTSHTSNTSQDSFNSSQRVVDSSSVPHVVVVGGGIMGSWATHILATNINRNGSLAGCKVTLVDAGHPIRGSWGDTRALHVAMEDDMRIKMNMLNVNEYLKLQREEVEAGGDEVLVKKVGRIFVGPEESMNKMHSLIQANGVPVHFVNKEFLNNPENKSVVETFKGIQLRCEENGFQGWKTIYTPVGYVMKANAILNYLRETTKKLAEKNKASIAVFEDHTVVSVDREKKTVLLRSSFSLDGPGTVLHYDKLLLTAGPWTNQMLAAPVMNPSIEKLPLVVSNEQTQDFCVGKREKPDIEEADYTDVETDYTDMETDYTDMPLVTYSDGGYVKSGGDYWFIVGPCPDLLSQKDWSKRVKVGFHRQGDIMDNQQFQLPHSQSQDHLNEKLIKKLPHVRKDIKRGDSAQSFNVDEFILDKAKVMVRERLPCIDGEQVEIVMRCLYQNTPDKEFIVGYTNHGKDAFKDNSGGGEEDLSDIVVACGFNGGGFQMGPMIARLCIKLLLSDHLPQQTLLDLLEVEQERDNKDYEIDEKIVLSKLLDSMKERFDPSRSVLWE